MRLVESAEVWEGWLGSHGQQLKIRRDISAVGGFPLRTLNAKFCPPVQDTRTDKGARTTSGCEKQQGCCLQGEVTGNVGTFLKGKCTKLYMQPLTLGSARGRTEYTRAVWAEIRVGCSGGRAQEAATQVPVLSHSLILQRTWFSSRFYHSSSFCWGAGDKFLHPIGKLLTAQCDQ